MRAGGVVRGREGGEAYPCPLPHSYKAEFTQALIPTRSKNLNLSSLLRTKVLSINYHSLIQGSSRYCKRGYFCWGEKDYATVCGTMAPCLVEKERLQN